MGIFDQLSAFFKHEPESLDDQPIAYTPERRSKPRINAREGTRVLIIDDSKTIVVAIRKYLRSAGFETAEAYDAETGLSMIREQKPDLVFLDIMLPGMNGFTALRTMRRDPVMQDIPVIMMSGNEQAVEEFYCSRIGADDFMKKPFTREDMFLRIERLLCSDGVPCRARSDADADRESPLAAAA